MIGVIGPPITKQRIEQELRNLEHELRKTELGNCKVAKFYNLLVLQISIEILLPHANSLVFVSKMRFTVKI